MNLQLIRYDLDINRTIGKLSIEGVYFCYTLEDTFREIKIPKMTCIPYGQYDVIIDDSSRFGRPMPHVLNVPGFDGVRIHAGNTARDTDGCILVGMNRTPDSVGDSRRAFDSLFARMQAAFDAKYPIRLSIEHVLPPEVIDER